MSILELPSEILLTIFSHLTALQVAHICSSCTYVYELSLDDYFWKYYMQNIYGTKDKIHPEQSWYLNYVYIHTLFLPQQLVILNDLRQRSLQQYNFLKTLYKYDPHGQYRKFPGYKDLPPHIIVVCIFKNRNIQPVIAAPMINIVKNTQISRVIELVDDLGKVKSSEVVLMPEDVITQLYEASYFMDGDSGFRGITLTQPQLQTLGYIHSI